MPARVALLEAIPEVGEGGLGHVGVAYQVVVVADQFIDLVTGDAAEGGVGVGDDAAQIRGGDELHVGGNSTSLSRIWTCLRAIRISSDALLVVIVAEPDAGCQPSDRFHRGPYFANKGG
jgi:hypothetical protein